MVSPMRARPTGDSLNELDHPAQHIACDAGEVEALLVQAREYTVDYL
jgi:hypothetical protein